ncbi:aminotransferase class I/II-fold pyridoxal phosphate-dependent enzyme [Paenibacillus taiwanensis]|uniref:aminotransferase class I/II-fold pyridoxal phosphate-dependent enzyme n=1 Tax=Paenibacillus taiwanensis TaxID=401638 RepID=UPI000415D57D|nr:aminotransferase class I/II-fold pyridoxal phosphate-dependent enzyme [Paenibacillus taiwanensis]
MNELTQEQMPLVEALLKYEQAKHVSMHVPGHKNGAAYERAARETNDAAHASLYRRYAALLGQDVTEVEGTDDLHEPTGAIREAQQLAAQCFGAEETYFLVAGSTSGNIAAILTCCTKPGDIVIVQRNVHKSVLHGLMLAGARAVFVSPCADAASGLLTAPSKETISAALQRFPEAKAVVLCNPNYYGLGVDLTTIAESVHAYGLPLIVDEAHGAHYGLHPKLPKSALQAGADLVVQSTHKMLLGMTMSAMLHTQGPRICRKRLAKALTMIQSSSPSYPLMASLDMSRHYVQTRGPAAFTEGLAAVEYLRAWVDSSDTFSCLAMKESVKSVNRDNKDRVQSSHYGVVDPFKVVIYEHNGNCTGYYLLDRLREHGVVAEMADMNYVVLLCTLGTTMADVDRIITALVRVEAQFKLERQVESSSHPDRGHKANKSATIRTLGFASAQMEALIAEPIAFSIFNLDHRKVRFIDTSEAAGYDAAEAVVPYPPGIPLLYAGETISAAHIKLLKQLSDAGAKCQDASDKTLRTLLVYEK